MPKYDDLEQRLRASRQRVRQDLQPPQDGWKKLSGVIRPEGTAPTASLASTIWWKWVLGCLLLTVVVATLWVRAESDPYEAAEGETSEPVTPLIITGPVATMDTKPDPQQSTSNATVSIEESKVKTIAPIQLGSLQEVAEPGVVDNKRSALPEDLPTESATLATADENAPGNTTDLKASIIDDQHPINQAADLIRDGEKAVVADQIIAAMSPTMGAKEEKSIVARAAEKPLAMLPGLTIDGLPGSLMETRFPTNLTVNSQEPPLTFASNGKPRVRPEWQIHASYNSLFSLYDDFNTEIYERGGGDYSQLFVLTNGEIVSANYRGGGRNSGNVNSSFLRVGVDRQTSSGFLFTLEGGAYEFHSKNSSLDLDGVGMNEIWVQTDIKEFLMTAALGLQYTFRKRRRFRPYLGVELLGFLYYEGSSRKFFYDEQTNSPGFVEELRIRDAFPSYLDFALVGGFQYKVNQRLSAGLSIFANGGYNTVIQAPIGLEVRYSLK